MANEVTPAPTPEPPELAEARNMFGDDLANNVISALNPAEAPPAPAAVPAPPAAPGAPAALATPPAAPPAPPVPPSGLTAEELGALPANVQAVIANAEAARAAAEHERSASMSTINRRMDAQAAELAEYRAQAATAQAAPPAGGQTPDAETVFAQAEADFQTVSEAFYDGSADAATFNKAQATMNAATQAMAEERAWRRTAPYLQAMNEKFDAAITNLNQGQSSLNNHTLESRDLATVKQMLDSQGHTVESSVVLERMRTRQSELIAKVDPTTGAPLYTHEQIYSDATLDEIFLREINGALIRESAQLPPATPGVPPLAAGVPVNVVGDGKSPPVAPVTPRQLVGGATPVIRGAEPGLERGANTNAPRLVSTGPKTALEVLSKMPPTG